MAVMDLPPQLWVPSRPAIIRPAEPELLKPSYPRFQMEVAALHQGVKRKRGGRRSATRTIALVSSNSDATDRSNTAYSWTSQATGVEAADRTMILFVGCTATNDVRSKVPVVTVGGTVLDAPAAIVGDATISGSGLYTRIAMYVFALATGTSANVAVSWTPYDAVNCGFAMYRATGLDSLTPYALQNEVWGNTAANNPWTTAVTERNTVGVGYQYWKNAANGYGQSAASQLLGLADPYVIDGTQGTASWSWSGLDEDLDAAIDTSGSVTVTRITIRALFA